VISEESKNALQARRLATASQGARKINVRLLERPERRFFRVDERAAALKTREMGIDQGAC